MTPVTCPTCSRRRPPGTSPRPRSCAGCGRRTPDRPRSTSESAARAGLAVSTASHHLSTLRAGGLVQSRRSGAPVLHARTALGDALVTANR
ncbi:ArsR/SmtB family transcription factor [Kineococcus sp. SYSU DK004]|uniref:ArsR/SmtB family transcription factor n=1 Tax=Kineococcus sp. SYSU DK004 TaxID=3383125 RepID=UPI003D7D2B4D